MILIASYKIFSNLKLGRNPKGPIFGELEKNLAFKSRKKTLNIGLSQEQFFLQSDF